MGCLVVFMQNKYKKTNEVYLVFIFGECSTFLLYLMTYNHVDLLFLKNWHIFYLAVLSIWLWRWYLTVKIKLTLFDTYICHIDTWHIEKLTLVTLTLYKLGPWIIVSIDIVYKSVICHHIDIYICHIYIWRLPHWDIEYCVNETCVFSICSLTL